MRWDTGSRDRSGTEIISPDGVRGDAKDQQLHLMCRPRTPMDNRHELAYKPSTSEVYRTPATSLDRPCIGRKNLAAPFATGLDRNSARTLTDDSKEPGTDLYLVGDCDSGVAGVNRVRAHYGYCVRQLVYALPRAFRRVRRVGDHVMPRPSASARPRPRRAARRVRIRSRGLRDRRPRARL